MRTLAVLAGLVAAVLWAGGRERLKPVFRWLPLPLWCYVLPIVLVSLGVLPQGDPAYRLLTARLLPFALALLLLGLDLGAVARTGPKALACAAAGSAGVILGTAGGAALMAGTLPEEAWRGAGALAGTWTGGSMNLVALRAVLDTPDEMFAPLIIVDTIIAYTWMALLVAGSSRQACLNRWLGAAALPDEPGPPAQESSRPIGVASTIAAVAIAGTLAWTAGAFGGAMPDTALISSSTGWAILAVTTAAIGLSFLGPIRALGEPASRVGLPLLYLVLAGLGAQADFAAFREAPGWLGVGAIALIVHAACLVGVGRLVRAPIGLIATASQANIGGFVSAPLVGAVYHRTLAPAGLLLAIGCNAAGTYAGIIAASLCRWIS
ncbi:MAG TPA: DUF819 family protein [bacterium]